MRVIAGLAALAGIGAIAAVTLQASQPAEAAISIPAPRADVTANGNNAVAVFAGGCFWGLEGVFERVRGVRSVTSGFAGGNARDANYETVSGGDTGHAEAVRIVYDPRQVSYGQLLQVYFSVAHDPTQLNRQGPDSGTQYRSAVFPQDAEQRRVAAAYIQQLGASGRYQRPIVTRIEQGGFFPAEAYHQNYLRAHPDQPYIVVNDMPKVRELRAMFPQLWSNTPAA